MELALGGDLFDMVETGRGLAPDLAHFYFRQLINGLDFLHAHGVAHRDIKPENLMLDAAANLKIGDFGLAALFRLQKQEGQRRKCTTVCGSPPYVAPEVLTAAPASGGYDPDRADIWSAGVVLYVLLVGTTPWAAAIDSDLEYREYFPVRSTSPSSAISKKEQGSRRDSPAAWDRLGLPADALSMLKCLLKPDPTVRMRVPEIRTHPWFLQHNPYLAYGGHGEVCSDPDGLVARVLANFYVDLTDAAYERAVPSTQVAAALPSTSISSNSSGPATVITGVKTNTAGKPLFASQQLLPRDQERLNPSERHYLLSLAQDPLLVQFRKQDNPAARELALTHLSQQYIQTQPGSSASEHQKPTCKRAIMNDLLLGRVWTKFYSLTPLEALVPAVTDVLFQLGASVRAARDSMAYLNQERVAVPLRIVDRRGRMLRGTVEFVKIERFAEVSFIRVSGDNLEWRFMFKRAVVLCRHHLFLGDTAV